MSSKVVLFWSELPATEQIITEFLKDNGYDVLIANGEFQCYKYISRRHVDLVLLDIQRSDLSGLILTKKIRSFSKLRHTPIISVIKNNALPKFGDFTWDCDDYISKPIDKDLLLNKMNTLMEKYFF